MRVRRGWQRQEIPQQQPAAGQDPFLFLDPTEFPEDFAADLPVVRAEFMTHAQMPAAAKVFTTHVANPAWKLKPNWYMVANARLSAQPAYSHRPP